MNGRLNIQNELSYAQNAKVPIGTEKKCSKCGEVKPISEIRRKNSLVCRKCEKGYFKAYNDAHGRERREQGKLYYTSNREEMKRKRKLYYETHKKELALYFKAYRQKNKERIEEKKKIYRINHKEEQRKRTRAYSETHKEKILEYRKSERGKIVGINISHKRRVLTKQGDVTVSQIEELFKKCKKCYWCEMRLTKKTGKHLDHYVPLSKGGAHTLKNLVVSCAYCNLSKNAKDPYLFAEDIGKLF